MNSKELVVPGVKLAEFGAWLVAHDYYNWRRLKRGKQPNEYDMADLERAGDSWFLYRVEQQKMADNVVQRLELARHPSGWWPRVARVLLHGYWGTAYEWWSQKIFENPEIEKSVKFTGSGLARALWVCMEAGDTTMILEQMVNQVAFADAVAKAGSDLYKKARRSLNDEELEAAKCLFLQFDLDGSGTIEMVELHSVLQSMGLNMGLDQVQGLLDSVDEGFTGEIGFDEFIELLETIPGLRIC